MTAGEAPAAGKNMLWNGAFDAEHLRPWSVMFDSPRFGSAAVTSGELCFKLAEPSVHPVDVVLRQRPLAIAKGHHYQIRLKAHATAPTKVRARLSKISAPYTELWSAIVDADATAKTSTGDVRRHRRRRQRRAGDRARRPAHRQGASDCLPGRRRDERPGVRAAHAQARPRNDRSREPGRLPAAVREDSHGGDQDGDAGGMAAPRQGRQGARQRQDPSLRRGQVVGRDRPADRFLVGDGRGQGLQAEGRQGREPAVRDRQRRLQRLKHDALAFFYLQRSGVPIKMPYAGSKAYERPPATPATRACLFDEAKCDYSLDCQRRLVRRRRPRQVPGQRRLRRLGAADELEALTKFGSTAGDFGDGKLIIPEGKNGKPDLLDEARFGLEALLKMQVPAGKPMAGMVHQKMHGDKWSAIPTAPDKDDINATCAGQHAATLNLAGAAAQAARLWKTLDPAFSQRCLNAAETAYAAAQKNPKIAAEPKVEGGGIYGDGDTGDEFYWAATEL
jgi:endoglucanase